MMAEANISRRALLSTVPALGVAGVIGAGGSGDTPVMRAYREWDAMRIWRKTDAARAMSQDAQDALVEWHSDLSCAILDMPAENAADFIAKVVCFSWFGEVALPDHLDMPSLWDEAIHWMGE